VFRTFNRRFELSHREIANADHPTFHRTMAARRPTRRGRKDRGALANRRTRTSPPNPSPTQVGDHVAVAAGTQKSVAPASINPSVPEILICRIRDAAISAGTPVSIRAMHVRQQRDPVRIGTATSSSHRIRTQDRTDSGSPGRRLRAVELTLTRVHTAALGILLLRYCSGPTPWRSRSLHTAKRITRPIWLIGPARTATLADLRAVIVRRPAPRGAVSGGNRMSRYVEAR